MYAKANFQAENTKVERISYYVGHFKLLLQDA